MPPPPFPFIKVSKLSCISHQKLANVCSKVIMQSIIRHYEIIQNDGTQNHHAHLQMAVMIINLKGCRDMARDGC